MPGRAFPAQILSVRSESRSLVFISSLAPGFSTSANADLIAIYLTGLATVLLLAIPFIPGLRDIPRWIPVHRLIWRNWNNQQSAEPSGQPAPGPKPESAGQK